MHGLIGTLRDLVPIFADYGVRADAPGLLDFQPLLVEQMFLIGPSGDQLLSCGTVSRRDLRRLPAEVLSLSAAMPGAFPSGAPSSLKVESMTPLKQRVVAGLGYGLQPFSSIQQELATGALSAARLPRRRAERETITALKLLCRRLIAEGRILTAGLERRR